MLHKITEQLTTSHGIAIEQITVIDVSTNVEMNGVKSDVAFAEHQTIDNKRLLSPQNLTQVSKFHLSGSPEKGLHSGRGNILQIVAVYQNSRLVFGESVDYSNLAEYKLTTLHHQDEQATKSYVPLRGGNELKTTKKAKANPGSERTTTVIRKVKYKISWGTRYFNPELNLTVSRYLKSVGGRFELKQDELASASIFLVCGDNHIKVCWITVNDLGHCVLKQTAHGYENPELMNHACDWFNTIPVKYLDMAVVPHTTEYNSVTKCFVGFAYTKEKFNLAKKIRKPGKAERLAAKARVNGTVIDAKLNAPKPEVKTVKTTIKANELPGKAALQIPGYKALKPKKVLPKATVSRKDELNSRVESPRLASFE